MNKINNNDIRHILGINLRSKRINLGLSQEELAEKADLSKNYIGQIENGLRYPSSEVLEVLCEILQTPYFEMFVDTEFYNIDDEKEKLVKEFCSIFETKVRRLFK